jgi:hypothetical protein
MIRHPSGDRLHYIKSAAMDGIWQEPIIMGLQNAVAGDALGFARRLQFFTVIETLLSRFSYECA